MVDRVTKHIFLLSSLDNWHQRVHTSEDDGQTWSTQARDLDSTLRMPGWGLVFTGLPGGIQLQTGEWAGRLIICSSAYWSGGEVNTMPAHRLTAAPF